ncbi:MAG: repressor LexA [Opitutaceae bacterium]|jgi:repressor LexA|nr:repressor LexA [Opitutaceae bacterium]
MLTERQDQILDFVKTHQRTHGVPPSTRQIGRQLDSSQATVMGHLRALAKKSQLEKLADGKWGLRAAGVQTHLFEASIYGSIPAGLPAMQEQTPDETITVDPSLFGVRRARPDHFWFLRVRGDSMIDAHILDGDLVALERREPRPGDIIAALVDETETTLKRLVHVGGRLILRAANARYADIIPTRGLESQGVVVGLIRRGAA